MKTITEILQHATPVMPVIVIDQVEHALPMAEALANGGVTVLEITLRTAAALPAIERIAKHMPHIIVGAGTVLSAADYQRVKNAGAQFAISPGLTATLAAHAQHDSVPLLPGAVTASEIQLAMEYGYTHLKFFPAETSGGIAALKALQGPFGDIRFCPTGGINTMNAAHYLALKNVACVGGSWLTPAATMQEGNWSAITTLAKQSKTLAQSILN